jgi:hypothetical protein
MRLRNILKDSKGHSTPLTVALILGLLLLICAISEFFRLGIIVQGVRDGLQQAIITVATTNYDEAYNGLREGYSGGYALYGENWQENLDYDDVYYRLDNLLGTNKAGGYHIKEDKGGYEYRLSGLSVNIVNAPLTPGGTDNNFEADARITIEIPLSFGWDTLPPLQMEIRTRSAYMPKF